MYDLCGQEVEYKCVAKKSIQKPWHDSMIKPYMTYFLTEKGNVGIFKYFKDFQTFLATKLTAVAKGWLVSTRSPSAQDGLARWKGIHWVTAMLKEKS